MKQSEYEKERDEAAEKYTENLADRYDGRYHPKVVGSSWFKVGADWANARAEKKVQGLVEALEQIRDHCLCERNIYGFDYGEKHKRLGKPEAGKRWLQPYDIIKKALEDFKKDQENETAE